MRELENILERALALAEEDRIGADDLRLPQHARVRRAVPRPPKPWPTCSPAAPPCLAHRWSAAPSSALEENRWNKTRTAAQLGITFRALRYKLKKLGMEPSPCPAARWSGPRHPRMAWNYYGIRGRSSTHGVDLPEPSPRSAALRYLSRAWARLYLNPW